MSIAYEQEKEGLLRYLTRRAGSDGADLLHEVFVRALMRKQSGPLLNPAAFLQRVARNLLIDRGRREERSPFVACPLEEVNAAAYVPEQEDRLVLRDTLRLYERALDELPDKTREIFLMHRVQEMPYKEIARHFQISGSSVEYHMMKALGHLASRIDAQS